MEPPREQVCQDHQCVTERLTFGERIGAVLDPHRRFDVIESAGSDLVKNLRGVGHPILAKVRRARVDGPAQSRKDFRFRLVALLGHVDGPRECLFLGVDRKWSDYGQNDAIDSFGTFETCPPMLGMSVHRVDRKSLAEG